MHQRRNKNKELKKRDQTSQQNSLCVHNVLHLWWRRIKFSDSWARKIKLKCCKRKDIQLLWGKDAALHRRVNMFSLCWNFVIRIFAWKRAVSVIDFSFATSTHILPPNKSITFFFFAFLKVFRKNSSWLQHELPRNIK